MGDRREARLVFPVSTVFTCGALCDLVCEAHYSKSSTAVILGLKSKKLNEPIPVFLPGEFHGQWSLAGHSPWGRKEWDPT